MGAFLPYHTIFKEPLVDFFDSFSIFRERESIGPFPRLCVCRSFFFYLLALMEVSWSLYLLIGCVLNDVTLLIPLVDPKGLGISCHGHIFVEFIHENWFTPYNFISIFSKEFSKYCICDWISQHFGCLVYLFLPCMKTTFSVFVDFVTVLFLFVFVFVFFPFLNQEADPCFGQILADSARNLFMCPYRPGSLFSPVFFIQSSAWFCWKLPQTHLPFLQFLLFRC